MDLNLLRKVNRLWRKIYPYLVSQIMETYQRDSGTVLEVGPFSGGISVAMAKRYPDMELSIAAESSHGLASFRDEIAVEGLSDRIDIIETGFCPLAFKDSGFDLVICRGAFFFLDEEGGLFREIFRMLNGDGLAFIGGGYGKDTPQSLIDEISDESRVLNDDLGRKRVSIEDLEKIVMRSGLNDHCKIVEEGGLWVVVDKRQS